MILFLYDSNETAFDHNGIGALHQAIDATVDWELNGIYELELQYPFFSEHFSQITLRSIILASPDPVTRAQPFRVYRITKPLRGVVTIYARHIAYDLMGIPVIPFSASSAADAMLALRNCAAAECPFTFATDKATAGSMGADVPKSIWTLLGSSEGSVLDVYGGEYEFDRFSVMLYERLGTDRGVTIRYGKNLTSFEQDENCSACYTGVYPYWSASDGSQLIGLPERIVPCSGNYDYVKILSLDLSEKFQDPPTEEQLRSAAREYINSNAIGTPVVSWTVGFVRLEQTEEYKGTALLERVCRGDTVKVEFTKMGVDAGARVVKTRYKPLLDRYEDVTLGSVKANFADTIVQQGKEIQSKPSVSLMQSAIMILTAAILGANGGAIRLLDTDGDGMPDTLYVADDPDPAKALKVWRWNYEGWAGSKTGYNGPFILGATLEDGLLASAVTAANLVAGTIRSADDGKTFFLDLDNGILRLNATELSINGSPIPAPGATISSAQEQFYLSVSPTAPTGGTWSEEQPFWQDGYYLFRRTLVTYGDGSTEYSPGEDGVCITGNTGATGAAGASGVGIRKITEYYARSTGGTTAPSSWVTSVPTLTSTYRYLWNYEVVTLTDGNTIETAKRVIGVYGNTGSTGATGNGISSVVSQYYLSTSATTQTGGSWGNAIPTITEGKYLWTRSLITYTSGATEYAGTYCVSKAMEETAGPLVDDLDEKLNQTEVFNRLTNNGQNQGIYLKNGKLYINMEYADTGFLNADYIALQGLLSVYFNGSSGTRFLGGHLGYMSGSVDGIVTDGVAIANGSKDCFVIATSAGARMQAGNNSLYVMKSGGICASSDGVTEWLDPPLMPGVEYRTTQRWKGKVVYTKLVEYAALPKSTTAYVSLGLAASEVTDVIDFRIRIQRDGVVEMDEATFMSSYADATLRAKTSVFNNGSAWYMIFATTIDASAVSADIVVRYVKT